MGKKILCRGIRYVKLYAHLRSKFKGIAKHCRTFPKITFRAMTIYIENDGSPHAFFRRFHLLLRYFVVFFCEKCQFQKKSQIKKREFVQIFAKCLREKLRQAL